MVLACGGVGATEQPSHPPSVGGGGHNGEAGGRRGGGGGGGKRRGKTPAPTAPAVDSPAFRTFETEDGKYRVVFTTETKMKKTWSNMSGPAVEGSWSQSGDTVEVAYVPASHHGSSAETFVTRGECTLIRTARVDATSGQRIESPTTYVLDEKRCR